MSFVSSIIVVEDIARSRKLYKDILQLKVTADFGVYNVGFEGGLSLYRRAFFQELIGGPVNLAKHNNVVLYFEVENLEAVEKEILANGFEFLHRIKEQPWQQRNFRFYDYDGHVVEMAEHMGVVFGRLLAQGNSLDAVSKLTGVPADQILPEIEKHK